MDPGCTCVWGLCVYVSLLTTFWTDSFVCIASSFIEFHWEFCGICYSFLPLGGDDEDDDEPQADAVDYIAKFEVANDRSESPLTVPMQKQVGD